MPVVYGDELAENAALSRRSPQAQDFYTAMVARPVPDNFGRFRVSASHIALWLYPRREVTAAIRARLERLLRELGTGLDENDVLWRTWVRDGVTFAEMATWRATGNVWHRTPEPPWSEHVHTVPCLPSAIRQARGWGYLEEARFLTRTLNDLRGRSGGVSPLSVPSVPSVPSVTSVPRTTIVVDARAREAETAPADADDGCGPYVQAVLELYGQLPGTPPHPKPADRETATRLWKRGVPIETVRAGLLTAAARRELRNREEPLPSIGSLKYFLDAIEEARESPPDSGHVSYLAGKLAGHLKPATNGHPPRSETRAPKRAEEV